MTTELKDKIANLRKNLASMMDARGAPKFQPAIASASPTARQGGSIVTSV
jgi:hypothetical protein